MQPHFEVNYDGDGLCEFWLFGNASFFLSHGAILHGDRYDIKFTVSSWLYFTGNCYSCMGINSFVGDYYWFVYFAFVEFVDVFQCFLCLL